MIEQKDWEWLGYTKHFIGGDKCKFSMATKVGNYIISTVGDYQPSGKMVEIGAGRMFETMVFKAAKASCECCNWECDVTEQLDNFGAYNSPLEAQKGHVDICSEVSNEQD